ncbi:alpha/beta hydrolase family protein [Henriciella litoralis]|uniref:alpha/beta hydrolase family protein n=1 Tax=Henriciella litoralis TaxID=568102 RepID=UPI000A020DA0|nr:alpha/beta fold hydrolase [Henriciella litoralis]
MRYLLVCAWLILSCALATAQGTVTNELRNGLKLDDFLKEPALSKIEMSPSGNWLAALQQGESGEVLALVDLRSDEFKVRHVNVGEELFINWVEWASDDWLMISATMFGNLRGEVFTRETILDARFDNIRHLPIPMTRLILLSRDGQKHHVVFEGNRSLERRNLDLGRVVSFLPNDPDHFLIAANLHGDLDLFKVQISTGEYERVALGRWLTTRWFVDAEGNPAFRVDQNRRGTVLYYYGPEKKKNGDIKWRKLKTVRVSDIENVSKQTTDFRPLSPGPQLATYYVAARPEGTNTTGIYLYNFETGEILETIKTHPTLDIENAIINPETYEYLGSYHFEDVLKLEYNNPRLQAHIDGLSTFFEGKANLIPLDASRDGKKWLLLADGPKFASHYYVYSTDEAKIDHFGTAFPDLHHDALSDVDVIKYEARDGLEITGYYTVPNGLAEGEIPPLIMMPHGGPENRDIYEYNRDAQILAAQGYAVFQPNFRGSSGYGLSFADGGRRQWGRAMQTDIEDGLRYLQQTGRAEDGRACIVGYSYGGYAALAAATLTPDMYQCVIAGAAPSDLLEQLKYVKKEDGSDSENYEYWVKHMGHPSRDKDALRAISPAQLADRVKAPILLIHGENDSIVPIKQSELMADALRDAGRYFKFVRLEEGGHTYRTPQDQKKELLETLNFLDRYLPLTPWQYESGTTSASSGEETEKAETGMELDAPVPAEAEPN